MHVTFLMLFSFLIIILKKGRKCAHTFLYGILIWNDFSCFLMKAKYTPIQPARIKTRSWIDEDLKKKLQLIQPELRRNRKIKVNTSRARSVIRELKTGRTKIDQHVRLTSGKIELSVPIQGSTLELLRTVKCFLKKHVIICETLTNCSRTWRQFLLRKTSHICQALKRVENHWPECSRRSLCRITRY